MKNYRLLLALFLCFQTMPNFGILRQLERKAPETLQYLKTKPYAQPVSTAPAGYRVYSEYTRQPVKASLWGKPAILTSEQQAGLQAAGKYKTRGFKTWLRGLFEPEQNKVYLQFARLTAEKQIPELVQLIETTPIEVLNKSLEFNKASEDLKEAFWKYDQNASAQNMMFFVLRKVRDPKLQYELARLFAEKGINTAGAAHYWEDVRTYAPALLALIDAGKLNVAENVQWIGEVLYPRLKNEIQRIERMRDKLDLELRSIEGEKEIIAYLTKQIEKYPEEASKPLENLTSNEGKVLLFLSKPSSASDILKKVQSSYKESLSQIERLKWDVAKDESMYSYLVDLEKSFREILSKQPGLKGLAY